MAVYTKLSEEELKDFFLKYNLGKLSNYKEIKDASFLLATNPNHHLRTILVFKKQNIEIILPNEYVKNRRRVNYSIIPNSNAVGEFNSVVYEYLGLLWYFLNGRI